MALQNRYQPLYNPILTNPPTPIDLKIDQTLKVYMDSEMKLETDEEMEKRKLVLSQVEHIFLQFVRTVAIEILHLPEDEAQAAGGKLYISGSHKLGVREPKADIDTVCVAPNFCTREHFFTILKEEFMGHASVTEFNAVETALVPLMSFDFDGVSIDLLFARMADNIVPENLDILDDSILTGLDDATEKSLNGPRVTMMIGELVSANFQTFLIVLRCVRRWAKRKGLYGNKLGYLGGVNCNILVAFVCQLYPNASPSTLLTRFFQVYSSWQWPKPVMLNKIQQNPPNMVGKDRVVWSAEIYPHHLMPILTPAYPSMNSTEKVTRHTLAIMQQEFAQSHAVIKSIISERGKDFKIDWDRLFEPSDFFLRYTHYLGCHIIGAGPDAESRSWIGFAESRVLGFSRFLEFLPLRHPLHFYPVVSRTDKSSNSVCYFIGFDIDMKSFEGKSDKNIYIDECVHKFQSYLYDPDRGGWRGENRMEKGLEFLVEHYTWKKLPRIVFDIYGGFNAAKAKRVKILEQKALELSKAAQAVEKGAVLTVGTTEEEKTNHEEETGKKRPRSESVDGAGESNAGIANATAILARLSRQPLPVLKKPTRPTSTAPLIASVSWVMLPGTDK